MKRGLVKASISSILVLLLPLLISAFEFPTYASRDIAIYSKVIATSNCTTNGTGVTCSIACPFRSTFPDYDKPLSTTHVEGEKSSSQVPALAPAINTTNGQVLFNESFSDFLSVNHSGRGDTNQYFSFSAWIAGMCTDKCAVLRIGGMSVSFINSTSLEVSGSPTNPVVVSPNTWQHIVIRFNGNLSWFINGSEHQTSTTSISDLNLSIGPGQNLTDNDWIAVADARWYADVLTDREITSLSTGHLLAGAYRSECRCPANAPSLVQETLPYGYLRCTNNATPTVTVSRLHPDAHPALFMIDNDTDTSWISDNVASVTVTLKLAHTYQIKTLELHGLTNIPKTLIITLKDGQNTSNILQYKTSCSSSDNNCWNITAHISSDVFSYDLEQNIDDRNDVLTLAAHEIMIELKGTEPTYFTIGDLYIEARCHCFGNDKDCSIANGTYACNCSATTHTDGTHCGSCLNAFYKDADGFACDACNCNMTGSYNNSCDEVGGQCACRPYVSTAAGRLCTECDHNSVNFTTEGCSKCECNSMGISYCASDTTCVCKDNVESTTGTCKSCIPNYYGIDGASGCVACDCDIRGTLPEKSQCNVTSGQCQCKDKVQGQRCNECKDGHFGLSVSWPTSGCEDCKCHFVGSNDTVCNRETGQCPCRDTGATDMRCVPSNLKLEPTFGPQAGGTLITITGHSLGGNNVNVTFIISNEKQDITSRNDSMIEIRTNMSDDIGEKSITLEWSITGVKADAYRDKDFEAKTKFTFMTNPVLLVKSQQLKSYAKGGCSVKVDGNNLDSVPHPLFLVHYGSQTTFQTICSHDGGSRMICKTPDVSQNMTNGTLLYGYGFDNVRNYENPNNSSVDIVPDPVVDMMDGWEFRNTFDKEIKIKGQRMNQACDNADVQILLGDKACSLLTRTDEYITCDPQESFPGDSRDQVLVIVQIGNNHLSAGRIKILQFWETKEFMYIAIGVGVFVVLLIVIVVACCACRRKETKEEARPASYTELDERGPHRRNDYISMANPNPVAMVAPINSAYNRDSKEVADEFTSRLQAHVIKVVTSSCIDRSQITLGKTCTHKGERVRVINGQFNSSTSSPFSGTSLTIKTLVERYPETGPIPSWLNDGLLESTRLRDYIHDNILRSLGIALDERQIYIIYPEMSKRTLKDYLIGAVESFSEDTRLTLCIEVAEGLNYLDGKHIVHKDVATRNCWVDSADRVKIGDASFTQDLYADEYLCNGNGRYQPVRWMAPESLKQTGFYHSKSDVWSFGVLMWEVFTNGYLPYHDIKNNNEIKMYVCDKGYRLGQPHGCSKNVFSVIEKCHLDMGDDRPNFFVLLNHLQDIISPGGDNQVSYVNEEELQDHEQYMNIDFGKANGPPIPARTFSKAPKHY